MLTGHLETKNIKYDPYSSPFVSFAQSTQRKNPKPIRFGEIMKTYEVREAWFHIPHTVKF